MRTGFDLVGSSRDVDIQAFLQKVHILLEMLTKESLLTAKRFSACCGRQHIAGRDMVYALKYQTRVFLNNTDIGQFISALEEQTDQTDSEESSDEEFDIKEEVADAEERQEYCDEFKGSDSERQFFESVKTIDREWSDWEPIDPVYVILKNAVDQSAMCCSSD